MFPWVEVCFQLLGQFFAATDVTLESNLAKGTTGGGSTEVYSSGNPLAFSCCCMCFQTAAIILSQLKKLARPMYSNPPVHGARIVTEVISSDEMFEEWKSEMRMMAGRIKSVRQELFDHLTRLAPEKDWSFVTRQIGMFSYTGMTPEQVKFCAK